MPKNKYDYCSECKVKLKRVKQRRTDYKKCAECRGDDIKGASELRAIFKELKKHSSKLPTEELRFEDDPRAEEEIEYGKVIKKSTSYVYSESSIADIIKDNIKKH